MYGAKAAGGLSPQSMHASAAMARGELRVAAPAQRCDERGLV